MKRIFKDADKKYTIHLGKLKKEIKKLEKSRIAWAILATGLVINILYLTFLWISDTI